MRDAPGPRAAVVGTAVALLGIAPLVVARFLWHPAAGGGVDGFGLSGSCQLLENTGIPCAGCGASRAVFHFVHGDSAFLDYNWFWVGALLALLAWGIALTLRGLRGRPLLGPRLRWLVQTVAARPALAGVFTVAFLAVPWTVALLNVGALRGG
jgi:Protein of unknown function (DUF2752)